jgi:[ribosomal protein S5]-alanine N-acetyltransferase
MKECRRMQILETDRLFLRQLTLDDTDDLYEILSDPQAMRYYPAPFTREQTIGWIDWNLHNYAQYGFGLWAVVRKDDRLVLGDCGLTMQPVEGQQEVEIGYHLKRAVWGNGYATEAALACRDYALTVLKAPRVVSIVHPQNMPSRRVAARVHTTLREFLFEKTQSIMCLYSTERHR